MSQAWQNATSPPATGSVQRRKPDVFELVFRLNEGFQRVLVSLAALRQHAALNAAQIRRFEDLAVEARAVTNSFLLETLGRAETETAGQLFRKRLARERKEEGSQ